MEDFALKPETVAQFAVFQGSTIHSGDDKTIDGFGVRKIDGQNVEFRKGGPMKMVHGPDGTQQIYVIVPPGKHQLTFVHRHTIKRKYAVDLRYDGFITREIELRAGMYAVHGEHEGEHGVIWATRVDTGEVVLPRSECDIHRADEAFPVLIPNLRK